MLYIKRLILIMSVILVLVGCANVEEIGTFYDSLKVGKFSGELNVQWYDFDKFVYIPSETKPLTFTRYNGETIIPGKMFTDGGSIPYPLRAFKQYSPWGYAPAYLIHDWLYNQNRCGSTQYEFVETSRILAEAIKTLMETYQVKQSTGKYEYKVASMSNLMLKDETILYSIYVAVSSKAALDSFNSTCQKPRTLIENPIQSYTIEFK